MIILGVDPGISGAVARLEWPSSQILEIRRDFKTLRDLGRAVVELSPDVDYAVIEQVGAMPGQGVTSMFSFGRSTGVALGAGYARDLDWIEIAPARWQSYFRKLYLGPGDPFDSRTIAEALFPGTDWFRRKKDHGSADAVLVAAYAGQEILTGGVLETSRKKNPGLVGPGSVGEQGGD